LCMCIIPVSCIPTDETCFMKNASSGEERKENFIQYIAVQKRMGIMAL